jgi:hypothetical protein
MGVYNTPQRFSEAHLIGGNIGLHFKELVVLYERSGHLNKGCIRSVIVVRHSRPAHTEVLATAFAVAAFTAGKDDIHDDAIADFYVGIRCGGFNDCPTKFVSENTGWDDFLISVTIGS